MSEKSKFTAKFPSKAPMKEMDKLINGQDVDNMHVASRNDEQLIDQPMRVNPGKYIPRVFKAPARALGVGISTVARVFGIKIKIDSSHNNN